MQKHNPFLARRARAFAGACLAWLVLCTPAPGWAADPTEGEIRDEYARWVLSMGNYQYRTRHILVSTREAATAALAEINAGAPFASVASRVSGDPGSRAKGGDLGWMLRGEVVPQFAVAFRDTQTGLYPEPVRTPFGWHVILIEEVKPVQAPRFEEVRGAIEAQLKKGRPAGAATAQAPVPPAAPAAPSRTSWSPAQWDAVYATAQHTAGPSAYAYREASFDELAPAQRASLFGVPKRAAVVRARNLIDVEPHLRFAISRLYRPQDLSPPVLRTLPDGRKRWTVLQLESRENAAGLKPDAQFQADAAVWVAKGHLPAPQQVLDTPQAMARIAYWRATDAQQIARVPADLSPEVEYGDGGTPLLSALLRRNMDAAKLLVQRGADVNHCGLWGCPIAYAARMPVAADALAWVNWLLASGARPDATDPRGPDLFATALGGASYNGYTDVAQRLVQAGASVNGVAGGVDTPIEAAASHGNKAMVEWLIARGASVLPLPGQGENTLVPHTLYNAARESKDAEFIQWAEQTMLQAAQRSPLYAFSVFFEQEGRRINADAKGGVRLKPAPFSMVFQFPEGVDGVQVGASLQAAWLAEFRKNDPRNAMFRPFASGAQANATEPNSQDLFVMQPCPPTVRPDSGCDGSHMYLGVDASVRDDFHERRTAGGKAYVRQVRTLLDTSTPATGEPAPLNRFAGQTLHIVMGVPLPLGGPAGLRLPRPQVVTVQFTR